MHHQSCLYTHCWQWHRLCESSAHQTAIRANYSNVPESAVASLARQVRSNSATSVKQESEISLCLDSPFRSRAKFVHYLHILHSRALVLRPQSRTAFVFPCISALRPGSQLMQANILLGCKLPLTSFTTTLQPRPSASPAPREIMHA